MAALLRETYNLNKEVKILEKQLNSVLDQIHNYEIEVTNNRNCIYIRHALDEQITEARRKVEVIKLKVAEKKALIRSNYSNLFK